MIPKKTKNVEVGKCVDDIERLTALRLNALEVVAQIMASPYTQEIMLDAAKTILVYTDKELGKNQDTPKSSKPKSPKETKGE